MKTAPSLLWLALAILCLGTAGTLAAVPPDLLNYQGVLRAADGTPLEGDHDMVFRFMSAGAGGDEILLDEHDAAHANPVTVTGGLFNAELGGGELSDGSGPGSYTTLTRVFRDYDAVWLEIEVDGETLDPRVRIISAAYALNADHLDGLSSDALLRSDASDSYTSGTLTMNGATTLDVKGTLRMDGTVTKASSDHVANLNADLLDGLDSTAFAATTHGHSGSEINGPVDQAVNADTVDGKHASAFLDTSATPQTKSGELSADASAVISSIGIRGLGQRAGGYFEDTTGSGHAYAGDAHYGVRGYGDTAGGYFGDSNSSAEAYVGYGNYGILGRGVNCGGYFEAVDGSGIAQVGHAHYGVQAEGRYAGGHFSDNDETGDALVAHENTGIVATGSTAGGEFRDSDGSGTAFAGYGSNGVYAWGDSRGGYFKDSDGSGYADVGYDHWGIRGYGNTGGGRFEDRDHSGLAYVGYSNFGIWGMGSNAGGYFEDTDGSGLAFVGTEDYGIDAHGNAMGGYFADSDESGRAHLAFGDYGVKGYGNYAGGYFEDSGATGFATVGYGNYGISAHGSYVGGHFEDSDSTGYAYLAYGNTGIEARGSSQGGYFTDTNSSGYARVAYGDRGIWAKGTFAGGTFSHPDNTTFWADVSTPTRKIVGSGTVSFVQNHPDEEDKVIAYAAPEGDEVAVYTRGSGRLVAGEARVPLGETFRWVTNPDIGLTAHVTPRSDDAVVYVESVSSSELVVRSVAGFSDDAAFDYLVYGLRLGFEELAVVQRKQRDAFPPTAEAIQADYEGHPELRSFNALERHREMRVAMGEPIELDMSGAREILAALEEQRAVALARAAAEPSDPSPEMSGDGEDSRRAEAERPRDGEGTSAVRQGRSSGDGRRVPMDEEGNVYGKSFRPSSTDMASLVEVNEPVEAGDVLIIDPTRAGMMSLARVAGDTAVFGIVATEPGVVLGSDPVEEGSGPGTDDAAEVGPDSTVDGTVPRGEGLRVPVAVSGMVLCKVDAGYGSILPGDLLTTSPTAGHAMRADEPAPGTILGKALEPLDSDTGLIRVLVMLR